MRKKIDLLFFAFFLFGNSFSQTTLFDSDWRFYRGGVQGAEMPGFDDSKWRKVDLPHDWSIEDLPGTHTPFDSTPLARSVEDLQLGVQDGIAKLLPFRRAKK